MLTHVDPLLYRSTATLVNAACLYITTSTVIYGLLGRVIHLDLPVKVQCWSLDHSQCLQASMVDRGQLSILQHILQASSVDHGQF